MNSLLQSCKSSVVVLCAVMWSDVVRCGAMLSDVVISHTVDTELPKAHRRYLLILCAEPLQNARFCIWNLENFPRVIPLDQPCRRGWPPHSPTPSMAFRPGARTHVTFNRGSVSGSGRSVDHEYHIQRTQTHTSHKQNSHEAEGRQAHPHRDLTTVYATVLPTNPCKIITPENINVKLFTRDCVMDVT